MPGFLREIMNNVKAYNISLAPGKRVQCSVRLPASKSESNRALLISALCEGEMLLKNISPAADSKLMATLLKKIKNRRKSGRTMVLDVKNAGTVMRFLTALLAVTPGKWRIHGDRRMNQRPVGILVEALKQLGAEIYYEQETGFPPLFINGRMVQGGKIDIDAGTSSQFISALMMIAPLFEHGLELKIQDAAVSYPYIALTAEVMRKFGASVTVNQRNIIVKTGVGYQAVAYEAEGDWTSASYWYEIAALSGDAEIKLSKLNKESFQGDSVLPDIYCDFGLKTTYHKKGIIIKTTSSAVIKEFNYDFTACPDLAQTLAVTCAALGIKARLKGLKTLRIKETDRIEALKTELMKAGCVCIAVEDELLIEGRINPSAAWIIETYNDHRMAMAFAPLAISSGNVIIDNPGVVVKSYPDYWNDLKKAGFVFGRVEH